MFSLFIILLGWRTNKTDLLAGDQFYGVIIFVQFFKAKSMQINIENMV